MEILKIASAILQIKGFKIDLIVWKSKESYLDTLEELEFKIDLIVWKSRILV